MPLLDVTHRLRALARGRSRRKALRAFDVASDNTLLICPSTIGGLELARSLVERQSCRVTRGPVTQDPAWRLSECLRTPAEIVREFAGEKKLGSLIISFPDQVAGEGESFVPLRFLGLDRRFSLLEAVLVLRHQPRVLQLRSTLPSGAYRLLPVQYSHALSAADHRTAPLHLLRTLLEGLEAELANPSADWLGAASFALKNPVAYEFHARENLKEVESILRLVAGARTERQAELKPALDSVTALVRGRRH